MLRTPRVRLPALHVSHLWALSGLLASFVATALSNIQIADFWWHIKVGESILTRGYIPATDTFSFVASGREFTYQQWLGEVYLYLVYSAGGTELVVLANALLFTATTGVVMLACYEASHDGRVAAGCGVGGMLVGMANRDARPQIVGFFFFSLLLLVLLRYRRGRSAKLWALPLLSAVWANVHGSALVGLGLAVLVLGAEGLQLLRVQGNERRAVLMRTSKLALFVAAMPAAMLLNPKGAGLLDYLVSIQTNPVIQNNVTEWFAPSIRNTIDAPFFVMLLACIALFALSNRPLGLTDTILFVAFTILGLQAVRNSVWFGMVAAPIVAGVVAGHLHGRPSIGTTAPPNKEIVLNYAFAAVLVSAAVMTVPSLRPQLLPSGPWQQAIDPDTPVAAVAYIAEAFPKGRFFNTEGYGSYMIWATGARPQVFVDGRVELYPLEVWQDYIQISKAQGWEERLSKYGIRHVLLPKRPLRDFQRPLIREIEASERWERVYEDGQALVFVRKE